MVWEVVSHSASSGVKSEVVMTPQDFHMMGTLLRSSVSFHGLDAGDGTGSLAGKGTHKVQCPHWSASVVGRDKTNPLAIELDTE